MSFLKLLSGSIQRLQSTTNLSRNEKPTLTTTISKAQKILLKLREDHVKTGSCGHENAMRDFFNLTSHEFGAMVVVLGLKLEKLHKKSLFSMSPSTSIKTQIFNACLVAQKMINHQIVETLEETLFNMTEDFSPLEDVSYLQKDNSIKRRRDVSIPITYIIFPNGAKKEINWKKIYNILRRVNVVSSPSKTPRKLSMQEQSFLIHLLKVFISHEFFFRFVDAHANGSCSILLFNLLDMINFTLIQQGLLIYSPTRGVPPLPRGFTFKDPEKNSITPFLLIGDDKCFLSPKEQRQILKTPELLTEALFTYTTKGID